MQAICTFHRFVVNYHNHAAASKSQCRQLFDACRKWLLRLRSVELRTLFEIEFACLLDLVDCAERASILSEDAAKNLKGFLSKVLSERPLWAAAYQDRYLALGVYTTSSAEASFRTTKRASVVSCNCELSDLYRSDREARMRWIACQSKKDSDPFKRSNMELGAQPQCIKDAFRNFHHEYAKHFAAEYTKAEKMSRLAVDGNLIEVVSQDTTPKPTLPRGGFSAADATKLEQLISEQYSPGEATCGLRFDLARGDLNEPWRFYLPERPFAQFVKRAGDQLLCQACTAGGEQRPCQQAREKGGYLRVLQCYTSVSLCYVCMCLCVFVYVGF